MIFGLDEGVGCLYFFVGEKVVFGGEWFLGNFGLLFFSCLRVVF